MRYRLVVEELEVDKLMEDEKDADRTGDYDMLYLKNQNKIDESNEASDQDEPISKDSDSPDALLDDEVPEDVEVAKESLRNLVYDENVATEIYGVVSSAVHMSKEVVDAAWHLAKLGIQYTPTVARRLFRGVLLMMSKVVRVSLNGIETTNRYVTRRINSFTHMKEEIEGLKKLLSEIKEAKDVSSEIFDRQKTINLLKIGRNVDLTKNVDVMTKFVSTSVDRLSTQIQKEIAVSKRIMDHKSADIYDIPMKLMLDNSFANGLSQGRVNGFEPDSEHVVSYMYPEDLPGDVKFISFLPEEDINDLGELAKAYNSSKLFLGFDAASFEDINSINYMTIDELTGFLDKLNDLCEVCAKHQEHYEAILSKKKSLMLRIKHYFNGIIASDEKVSIKNSLLEFLYLKSIFIDKVYLVAAMDIHDYSIRVITNGLLFAKDNARKLM